MHDNPGRRVDDDGLGEVGREYPGVEVDLGPNEKLLNRYDLLELVEIEEKMLDPAGRLGGLIGIDSLAA